MIRLNERLGVTEEQKTEITQMLFGFMKKLSGENKQSSTSEIMSLWLIYASKPMWLQDKLGNDIEFVAGVYEFIDNYKTITNLDTEF